MARFTASRMFTLTMVIKFTLLENKTWQKHTIAIRFVSKLKLHTYAYSVDSLGCLVAKNVCSMVRSQHRAQ